MTVIDLRDELYRRKIDIIEITDEFIYYAEELKINGVDTIYLYSYSFSTGSERVMSYFTFDDATYLQHYYACKNSIIVLFENDTNRVWIVKVDKNSNEEVYRKKIPLIGRFFECVSIDDNNIIIYSKADSESRELFNRCLEETNSDCLANLYDLEQGYRYFVKDFRTAMLVKNSMYKFIDPKGTEQLLLCDPYCDESEKEELSRELSKVSEDIRDNIWIISKEKFLDGVKNSLESIGLKKVASAGAEGLVRFECISDDKIVFRAKVFAHGKEQFFEMSTVNGEVKAIGEVKSRNNMSHYFTDIENGRVYYMTRDDDNITLKGEINSNAVIKYPHSIGKIESCIDDRFVIADSSKSYGEPLMSIYDGRLNLTDTYQARVKTKGEILVFF